MVTYYSNVQRDGGRDLTIQELAEKFESAERATVREGETVQEAKRRTYGAVQVAPFAGAWIETSVRTAISLSCQSHPSRVRGLKPT